LVDEQDVVLAIATADVLDELGQVALVGEGLFADLSERLQLHFWLLTFEAFLSGVVFLLQLGLVEIANSPHRVSHSELARGRGGWDPEGTTRALHLVDLVRLFREETHHLFGLFKAAEALGCLLVRILRLPLASLSRGAVALLELRGVVYVLLGHALD